MTLSLENIIFICPFDQFGLGRHIYTFENICKEDKNLFLKDGTTKIFLNAKGTMDDVSPELKAFLDYVAGKRSNDLFVDELEKAVKTARKNREWRHEYMTLLMRDQENMEIGREEGRAEGIITIGLDVGLSEEELLVKLQNKLDISYETAQEYLERFGKQIV